MKAQVREAKQAFLLHDSSESPEKQAEPRSDACGINNAFATKSLMEQTYVLEKMSVVTIN